MSVVTIAEAWPAAGRRILNPDPPQAELTVFDLRDGGYARGAKTSEPFAADHPFTVSIDLADLTRGSPRSSLPGIR